MKAESLVSKPVWVKNGAGYHTGSKKEEKKRRDGYVLRRR